MPNLDTLALANLKEAMALWIDTAIELGRDIPQPLTPRIPEGDAVPHEVVGLHVKEGMTYLRAWREYLGLTQAELAEKAGITQAALSRMENGESKLRKATRQKLASAMGINSEHRAAWLLKIAADHIIDNVRKNDRMTIKRDLPM